VFSGDDCAFAAIDKPSRMAGITISHLQVRIILVSLIDFDFLFLVFVLLFYMNDESVRTGNY
jgi:hypothetical protein